MKTIILLLSFAIIGSSFATVKITVADGDWFNAATWNPSGVPLNEDTVIIDHDIIVSGDYVDFGANWLIVNSSASIICDTTFGLHGNLLNNGLMDINTLAVGDGDSTLIYGTVDGLYFAPGNPNNINYGSILCDTLVPGDDFDNYGLLEVLSLSAGGPVFINHSGAAILVSGFCTFSTNMTNQSGATMDVGDLVTSGNSTNDGDISCNNWTHGSGTAGGTTGKYCIDLCFINNATVSGTIDVCDATPGGFCDVQMGTIAGTVTNCTVGSCTSNVGIEDEEFVGNPVLIYPNPVNDLIYLENGIQGTAWQIVDLTGKVVLNGNVELVKTEISAHHLQKGVYFMVYFDGAENKAIRLVKQ